MKEWREKEREKERTAINMSARSALFWSKWWWHTEFLALDSTVLDNIRYISVDSASAVLGKPRQELVNAMYSIWEEASGEFNKELPDNKKWPEVFSVIDNVEVVTQDELWRLLSSKVLYPNKG